MKVGRWSTTAGNNNATPPDGWPEGQAPSTVNDCARELMAAVRTVFTDAQYFDQDFTPTFINATSFSVLGNQTSAIHAGRRLKLFDGQTIYGHVTTASFTTVTTIHLTATASLTSSLSSFGISILSNVADALPRGIGRFTPVGGIIMWSGSIASIPNGWALCDGTNGTPDLRSKFIVGAGSTYAVAATGGTADAAVVTHTHAFTATTGGHSVDHTHSGTTGGQSANHQHQGPQGSEHGIFGSSGTANGPDGLRGGDPLGLTGNNLSDHIHGFTTGGASADHTHTVSGTTSATGAVATNLNLPPYYALAYIMCLSG